MRKLMLKSIAIACATLLYGCGNSHEKMVKELYAAVQSGNQKKAMENFAPGLDDMLKYNKDTKKVFRTVSESKEPVKTEMIKTVSENGVKASIISAKCDGTTLYFVVGGEKDKDDKILFVSTDKSAAMKGVADEDVSENTRKSEKLSKPHQVVGSVKQNAVPHKKFSKKEETEMLLAQLRKYCKDNGADAVMPSIETMLAMTDEKDRPEMLRKTLQEMNIKPCVIDASCEDAGGNSSVPQSLTASMTTTQSEKCTVNKSAASNGLERLTPEQKVKRLMAQLRKVLGNSMEVSLALAAIQEKVDQVPGDYKTKCVLQEMFGLQSKIPGGVIPDLPDSNGNGVLADYLKVRELDNAGQILCFYHMLSDAEQASVAEEVRKLMK